MGGGASRSRTRKKKVFVKARHYQNVAMGSSHTENDSSGVDIAQKLRKHFNIYEKWIEDSDEYELLKLKADLKEFYKLSDDVASMLKSKQL